VIQITASNHSDGHAGLREVRNQGGKEGDSMPSHAKHHKKATKQHRASHHRKRSRVKRVAPPTEPTPQQEPIALAAVEAQAFPPFADEFVEVEVEAELPAVEVVDLEDWQL
jgi:hypothetical protein